MVCKTFILMLLYREVLLNMYYMGGKPLTSRQKPSPHCSSQHNFAWTKTKLGPYIGHISNSVVLVMC